MNKINEEDLAYHRQVVRLINDAFAIRNHWYSYLASKYKLQGQDAIDESGNIQKLPAEPTPQ